MPRLTSSGPRPRSSCITADPAPLAASPLRRSVFPPRPLTRASRSSHRQQPQSGPPSQLNRQAPSTSITASNWTRTRPKEKPRETQRRRHTGRACRIENSPTASPRGGAIAMLLLLADEDLHGGIIRAGHCHDRCMCPPRGAGRPGRLRALLTPHLRGITDSVVGNHQVSGSLTKKVMHVVT
jgi:hypothetical protein